MTATGQTRVTGIALWGARMVAWNDSPYLFFSAASNFSTWAATNYIIVGYSEDPISVVVPRNYDLIIGKPSGWYSVTGVLNYSAAVRQINSGLGVIADDPVAEWNNSVVFNCDTGTIDYPVNLYTVNGARVSPMMFQRFSTIAQEVNIAKGPLGVLQIGLTNKSPGTFLGAPVDGRLWLLNQQNRWSKITIQNGTPVLSISGLGSFYNYPALAYVSRSNSKSVQRPVVVAQVAADSSGRIYIAVFTVKIPTFEPGKTAAGGPSTATALLSDYSSQVPITVKDVFVEAEVVELDNEYLTDGSISVRTNMKYPIGDLALSAGEVTSSTLTTTVDNDDVPGTGTRFLGRVYRFRPDNPGYGYGIEIQVQFSGVKVRRVMAVIEEQR
jgi:hypothetical protein